MAKSIVVIGLLLIFSSLFTAMPTRVHEAKKQTGPEAQKSGAWFQDVICQGPYTEKAAKLHFYVQDLLGGENTTVYEVARASITSNSPTTFGQVRVLDDKLTADPDYNSEEVGRAQGLITSSDLTIFALTMNLNFVFTSGKYNGSTISIAGRNQINNPVRELPVIGGTGEFRMARGYAFTNTYSYDPVTNYGVLEYKIYVSYVDSAASSMQIRMKVEDI